MALRQVKVAVVGSGVSGLASAWLLQQHGAQVTLYEAEGVCGGHTLTDTTSEWPVDLGFQVYNLTTYPNLIGWFEQLGVTTEPSNMSFSLSVDGGKLEWASHDLDTIFAQRRNVTSPAFLRMLHDVIRFGKDAPKVLLPENQARYKAVKLQAFLDEGGYGQYFKENYLIPMCAAVWSVPGAQVMEFPVQMLVRFWVNHHLLDVLQRPLWRVVTDRSRQYVAKVVAALPEVLTSTRVDAVVRTGDGRVAVTADGVERVFDKVVLATHSDTSLALRGSDITPAEREVLSAIGYNDSTIYLHTDASLMPVERKAWASWNFLGRSGRGADTDAVCVSYWLNLLQHLPATAPDMFVTLNPREPPAADKIIRKLSLAHPVFSFDSWHAQQCVPGIQNTGGIYYAGAWCGYGFHEDGMNAAVAVLADMGLRPPWAPRATSPKSTLLQSYFQARLHAWASLGVVRGHLRLVLPNGSELAYGDAAAAGRRLRLMTPAFPVALQSRVGTSATAALAQHAAGELPPLQDVTGIEEGTTPLTALVRVYSLNALQRAVCRGDVGLGEAFCQREFEVDDLGAFATVLALNQPSLAAQQHAAGVLRWLGGQALLGSHLARPTSIEGQCISHERLLDAHGAAFHRLVLGEDLYLGPAWHREGQTRAEDAQQAAVSGILAAADIRDDARVLDIGCAWGTVAFAGAARHPSTRWTATTLSKCQLEHVSEAVRRQGLSQLQAQFGNWRDLLSSTLPGPFDTILCTDPCTTATLDAASLDPFFAAVAASLAAGGAFVMLALTAPEVDGVPEAQGISFAQEHLLWGMHLPSRAALASAAAKAGLVPGGATPAQAAQPLGGDFAATLRQWRGRLASRWREALRLGVRDAALRRYEFGMAMAEASFEVGLVECTLLTWTKHAEAEGVAASATKQAVAEQRARLVRHFEVTKPVISGYIRALQCAALVCFGILINTLFEMMMTKS